MRQYIVGIFGPDDQRMDILCSDLFQSLRHIFRIEGDQIDPPAGRDDFLVMILSDHVGKLRFFRALFIQSLKVK